MQTILAKIDLACADVDRMAGFYQVLFAVPFAPFEMAGHTFRVGQVPGLGVFQLVPAGLLGTPLGGLNRFQLNYELEDGNNLVERLNGAGGQVEEPGQRDGDSLLYSVRDPEGNSLVIRCPDSTPHLIL